MDARWLADRLREQRLADDAHVAAALAADDFCLHLVTSGALEESALLRFLGLLFQTRYITTEKLSQAKIPQWVLDLVPLEVCEQHHVVPVRCDMQRAVLSVVTPSPDEVQLKADVARVAGVEQVQAHVALPHAVDAAIRKLYKGDIHAFARLDRLLAPNYGEMLETYDARLIDFDGGADQRTDLASRDPGPAVTGPSLPAVSLQDASPMRPPAAPSTPQGEATDSTRLLPLVAALVQLIEMGHGWRRGHSVEVARLVAVVGQGLNLPEPALNDLRLASLLHEVGKPPGSHLTLLHLDRAPRMRSLATQAWTLPAKLLAGTALPPGVTQILAAQYERLDGQGVPGVLVGQDVPLTARILAAADMFCEMARNPGGTPTDLEQLETALPLLFDEATARIVFALLRAEIAPRQPHRILIIDEDAEAAGTLEIDLVHAGYGVQALHSTAEAARALLNHQVDLIITEVRLRPVDGFDFLQRIRADARTQAIPVVFLTDHTDAADVARGLELGAAEYLVKPCDGGQVLAKVEAILRI